ncbi:hypothetical protein HMPREF1557_01282 [Streptococcus sobrinus W1703]|uniref:Uncharacterized protein n=1 Tax=Streptococcus sobrinus W1703 TaxID=1227275 RepID=U2J7C4_9STRE|nr:hypothetical protein HMPREF1557_01282 [Streptococcus sobrinus W1703]
MLNRSMELRFRRILSQVQNPNQTLAIFLPLQSGPLERSKIFRPSAEKLKGPPLRKPKNFKKEKNSQIGSFLIQWRHC